MDTREESLPMRTGSFYRVNENYLKALRGTLDSGSESVPE
jgi:hypothetical protein